MKKAIFYIILSALTFSSFSQPDTTSPALTKQDYLQKSKKLKTVAWTLLASGVTISFIGLNKFNFAGADFAKVNNGPAFAIFLTGTAAVITSIPFFSASKKNKKKAAAISLKMDRHPFLQTKGLASINYPTISFRLPI